MLSRLFSLQLLFAVAVSITATRLATSTHNDGSPRRLIASIVGVVVVVVLSSVMIRIIARIIGMASIVVVANLSREKWLHWINVLGFLVMDWRAAAVLLRD